MNAGAHGGHRHAKPAGAGYFATRRGRIHHAIDTALEPWQRFLQEPGSESFALR
jgi:hypothetical protein